MMTTLPDPSRVMQSAPGAETVIDGRSYLYFGGTSYLGLAGHPEVIEAACEAMRRYGLHPATSRQGFGNSPPVLEVERVAAEFFGVEAAFYLASGYASNHVLVQALAAGCDGVFMDEHAHYSIREAARISGQPVRQFAHGSPASLAAGIQRTARPLVMTDGVFPVTGALAPIREYQVVLARCERAVLLVDDAHGFGVLGDWGRGSLEHWGLWEQVANPASGSSRVAIHVGGTLSKAMGGYGGLILGTADFIHQARETSHYYAGASAPPVPVAAASAMAMQVIRRDPGLRQRLHDNIRRLREALRAMGWEFPDSPAANIGARIGDAASMLRLHQRLKAEGILVPYFDAYAGVGKAGRLRFAVCAQHTTVMIDHLLAVLRRLL